MASKNITIKNFAAELPGMIPEDDKITYVFPTVTSTNQHGSKTMWTIIVRVAIIKPNEPEKFVEIRPEFFDNSKQLPPDHIGWIKVLSLIEGGKTRASDQTYIKTGKNVGKANQTNVFTQALRDALSKYNKQAQKAKEEINLNGATLYAPMLSQPLKDEKITEKVYVQRKYDGVRIVSFLATTATGEKTVIMYSREKHLYPQFEEIKKQLLVIFEHFEKRGIRIYLDGELYKHGVNLQNISGIARREKTKQDLSLDYYIFDCFFPEDPKREKLPFAERKEYLDEMAELWGVDCSLDNAPTGPILPNIKFVETYTANSNEEVNVLYKRFLSEGYEGAMVRLNKPYKYSVNDYHSPWLLKMKPEKDAEFKIIGYTKAEKGKSEGALMFTLETADHKQFSINLSGGSTIKELKELYKKMSEIDPDTQQTVFDSQYKGRKLIVYFDDLSKDGIPVRARVKGIVLRDYE